MPDALRRTSDRRIAAQLDELLAGLGISRLAFCWPHRAEPDLRGWVADWLRRDPRHAAALPVVVAPRRPMVFRQWTPTSTMVADRFGIPHPADGDAIHPELVLVPVNAFDRQGYRIGYGGGYFDRTLATLDPQAMVAGIAYQDAEVPSALPQDHDVPMHWVVTDRGMLDCRPATSRDMHRQAPP